MRPLASSIVAGRDDIVFLDLRQLRRRNIGYGSIEDS